MERLRTEAGRVAGECEEVWGKYGIIYLSFHQCYFGEMTGVTERAKFYRNEVGWMGPLSQKNDPGCQQEDHVVHYANVYQKLNLWVSTSLGKRRCT